jgi:hypothetical protein
MEHATTNTEHCEFLDRLSLLLISRPEEGWEEEFKDITRREIQRLAMPAVKTERDE